MHKAKPPHPTHPKTWRGRAGLGAGLYPSGSSPPDSLTTTETTLPRILPAGSELFMAAACHARRPLLPSSTTPLSPVWGLLAPFDLSSRLRRRDPEGGWKWTNPGLEGEEETGGPLGGCGVSGGKSPAALRFEAIQIIDSSAGLAGDFPPLTPHLQCPPVFLPSNPRVGPFPPQPSGSRLLNRLGETKGASKSQTGGKGVVLDGGEGGRHGKPGHEQVRSQLEDGGGVWSPLVVRDIGGGARRGRVQLRSASPTPPVLGVGGVRRLCLCI